jgi:hypothetical protein
VGGRVLNFRFTPIFESGFRVTSRCVCMCMYFLEDLGVWEAFINCSPVQEILAPCAVFCCLWFSGDVSWMPALVQE